MTRRDVAAAFLPLFNPLYRLRVNLRNHRKILVVDGHDRVHRRAEHRRRVPRAAPEVRTLARHAPPGRGAGGRGAAAGVPRGLALRAPTRRSTDGVYFPKFDKPPGNSLVQVVHSGPDADYKAIRETYFAGILNARKRVWIASPYFVPDAGLRDALCLAARSGVDVRFLGLFRPDKWIPFLAARFYWTDMLAAGVKVYQYAARDDAHEVRAGGRRVGVGRHREHGQPQPAA